MLVYKCEELEISFDEYVNVIVDDNASYKHSMNIISSACVLLSRHIDNLYRMIEELESMIQNKSID